jgi:hypothetical protein
MGLDPRPACRPSAVLHFFALFVLHFSSFGRGGPEGDRELVIVALLDGGKVEVPATRRAYGTTVCPERVLPARAASDTRMAA